MNRRWTKRDDEMIINLYNEYAANNPEAPKKDIYKALENQMGVPASSINARHYRMKMNQDLTVASYNQYDDFLSSIEKMRDSYKLLVIENKKLNERITELEQQQQDYEVLKRVIDSARKIVVKEELGEYEKRTFKMAQNGDLVSI